MEAHELVNQTMERGDGERMASLFGKSAEWWNSFGRPPKTVDYQHGTGNKSPVFFYIQYISQRFAANPRSAKRLHLAVDGEIKSQFEAAQDVKGFCTRAEANQLLTQATEAIIELNKCDVSQMTNDDLLLADQQLADVEQEAADTRAKIRTVRRIRESQRRFKVG